jgi:hypothetical protein
MANAAARTDSQRRSAVAGTAAALGLRPELSCRSLRRVLFAKLTHEVRI